MKITVFCSSSDHLEPKFVTLAETLGTTLGKRGDTLVFGGGRCGLMGAVARAARAAGCPRIIGVYPGYFTHLAEPACDEHITTDGLRDRMAIMEAHADAIIALPGGIGTLHEIFDQLAPQSLKRHSTPLVILSPDGFYDKLTALFDDLIDAGFMRPEHRALYHVAPTVENAFDHLDAPSAKEAGSI